MKTTEIEPNSPAAWAAVAQGETPDSLAFIAEMRAAFGADAINTEIKAGRNGQPTFYLRENGIEIGTKDTRQGVSVADMVIGPLAATVQGRGAKK